MTEDLFPAGVDVTGSNVVAFARPAPTPEPVVVAEASVGSPLYTGPKTQLPPVLIPPTVGRAVLFYPASARGGFAFITGQAHAATIAFVHSDRMVNIMALDSNGQRLGITSVSLVHDGDPIPNGDHCRWMAYQIGQAKRNA